MKTARLCILAFLLLAAVTACAGGGPTRVAKEWFGAISSADGATALKFTCDQYRDEVQMAGILTAAFGLLGGIDPQSAGADMSDLDFEVTSKGDDSATVHVGGEIIVSLLGAAMVQEVDMNLEMIKEDGDWKVCGSY